MKKVIAILLAMLMLCSVMTVAFSVFAEEAPSVSEEASTEETKTEEKADWFTELVNRLMQVFAKLLAKFGIKLALKGFDFSDLFTTTAAPAEAVA